SMSAGLGISHGISKSTNQKVVALIGDGTFFHSGISALINIVYNKSNPLIVLLDNRITAMTGHQENPGKILLPEEIASSCGVKHIKVLDPVNKKELEDSVKEFLQKEEVSLIVCRRICALLAKRQNG
ncbi:indolepyruvate ferredoxin oxidoreductase subunit alpha, partial [Patescibacteria group bacterium]|nr:indolepyruvate ferredoxin oxidoreductase subunit alpha [Patescibacteria group bacterium]